MKWKCQHYAEYEKYIYTILTYIPHLWHDLIYSYYIVIWKKNQLILIFDFNSNVTI